MGATSRFPRRRSLRYSAPHHFPPPATVARLCHGSFHVSTSHCFTPYIPAAYSVSAT
ncbi:UNVERIFIED_CONTAM: hypothetical protein Sradi_5722400 [Sesamum radiatum]|uniref:Uncharacterized protein n=1 Tax=Sesamum radiatum TaxID=300843 RepID=A0AAW2L1U8_SESRA